MEFLLKKDWDNLPTGNYNPSPYFSGRAKEIEIIKNIILHKTSGSVLVGAPRGTGKTDLMYKSMQKAKEVNRNFIPVVINASQFATNEKDELLKSLITRTYTTFNETDSPIFKNIKSLSARLYFQSTAKKFHEEYSNEKKDGVKIMETSETSFISVLNLTFDLKKVIDTLKKSITPALLPLIVLLTKYNPPTWLLYLLIVIFTLITIILQLDFGLKKSKKTVTTSTNEKDTLSIAKSIYLRDANIGNLEYELKELLKLATKSGFKIVFVIDELDKLSELPDQVLDVVKKFKGLFNHADALFLFIGDIGAYRLAETARKNRNDDARSTLFTQRIFLTRPSVSDMREYLEKVIESTMLKDREKLIDYIIYKSRMDYYSIQDTIRDLIVNFRGESPVIDWNSNVLKEQIVNKQTVISALLQEGRYLYSSQSDLTKNDDLIEKAYDVANSENLFEIPKEFAPTDFETENITQLQLKADVAKYLHIVGIYEREEIDREGRKYYYYKPTLFPGQSLVKLSAPFEFEIELFEAVDKFNNFLLNIDRFFAKAFGSPRNNSVNQSLINNLNERTNFSDDLYTRTSTLVNDLKKYPAKHPKSQEEIKKIVESLKLHQIDLIRESVHKLIKDYLDWKKIEYVGLSSDLPQLAGLQSIRNHIETKAIIGFFLVTQRYKKPRLKIISINPSLSIATDSEAMNEVRTHKVTVNEFYFDEKTLPVLSDDESKLVKVRNVSNFELFPTDI